MKSTERQLEAAIFRSRWILAPFYFGLVASMTLLLFVFCRELVFFLPKLLEADNNKVIVTVLALVDIVMVANLVLVVTFAGYENFVSKIDTSGHEDRPEWMGLVSFADLKIKLMGTIVAISGIDLLKTFLNLRDVSDKSQDDIFWRVVLHLTFVTSGVLFALMDNLAGHGKSNHKPHTPEAS